MIIISYIPFSGCSHQTQIHKSTPLPTLTFQYLHYELEGVLELFQPSGLSADDKKRLGKPKGLKLKREAKQWCRAALKGADAEAEAEDGSVKSGSKVGKGGAGAKDKGKGKGKESQSQSQSKSQRLTPTPPSSPCHVTARSNRILLAAALESVNSLLTQSPGCVGPRLPQILALAALAKAETLSFFRHAHDTSIRLRRDSKQYFQVSCSVWSVCCLLLTPHH